MDERAQARLEELKARLEELKRLNPAHCSGTGSFVAHSMPPELYAQVEELEEQIKELETSE